MLSFVNKLCPKQSATRSSFAIATASSLYSVHSARLIKAMSYPEGPSPESPPQIGPELTLFGYWGCPFVQRTWITLKLKEIPFKWCTMYVREKQVPWYKEIFPLKLVPGLAFRQEEKVVTVAESQVIMEFLDENFPETTQLLPKNPALRARAKTLAAYFASLVSGHARQLLMSTSRLKSHESAQSLEKGLQWLEGVVDEINELSGGGLGYVDVIIAPDVARLHNLKYWRGYDIESKLPPKVKQLFDRIVSHPAVAATFWAPDGQDYKQALIEAYRPYVKEPEDHFSKVEGEEDWTEAI